MFIHMHVRLAQQPWAVQATSAACAVLAQCGRGRPHRSRHCLPMRPGSWEAMNDQRCGPCCSTSNRIISSSCTPAGVVVNRTPRLNVAVSHPTAQRPGWARNLAVRAQCRPLTDMHCARTSGVHDPLIRCGLSTFCHRCRHCTSERPTRYVAAVVVGQWQGQPVVQIAGIQVTAPMSCIADCRWRRLHPRAGGARPGRGTPAACALLNRGSTACFIQLQACCLFKLPGGCCEPTRAHCSPRQGIAATLTMLAAAVVDAAAGSPIFFQFFPLCNATAPAQPQPVQLCAVRRQAALPAVGRGRLLTAQYFILIS
jgi:hypothetical protein